MNRVTNMISEKDTGTAGNSILLILVFITILVVPIFPLQFHPLLFKLLYTAIFLIAAFSLQKHRQKILGLAITVTALEWISASLDMLILSGLSKVLNIIFFIIIVIGLIIQVARTKKVNAQVILEAINGYLLLGMVFSLLVAIIMLIQPEAYNFPAKDSGLEGDAYSFSDCIYYAYITFTTVGYGDIVPKLPYTKSLAVLTGVMGQIYVAVIIAMLVGKFSSSTEEE
jgi:hypothetical protein